MEIENVENLHNQILKVQVPISTNVEVGGEEALLYNKTRDIEFFLPVANVKEFMGKEYKKFARVHITEEDIEFEELDDQGW